MKTILPLALLFSLSLCAFGQVKFEKGYYVTFQGDSISSYIKNEDWHRNPAFIEVKSSPESAASSKLTLEQVQRFGFEGGDTYATFAVDVDESPVDLNKIVANAAPTIVRDTVMLRSLVKGPVNLFIYTDNFAKTHYYVNKGGEEPRELLFQRVKRDVENEVTFLTLELYKGLLSVYLADCEKLKGRIQKTPFKQLALTELVLAHNACVDPSFSVATDKKEQMRLKIGAVAGLTVLSYRFASHQDFDYLVNSDFNGKSGAAGIALNVVLPRAHGRWTIVNELMLKPYVAKHHYENRESASNYQVYDIKFRLLYAGVNNLVRYALTTGNIRPFINIGMANNLMLSDNSQLTGENSRYGIVRSYDDEPLHDMRRYEQALIFGAGVSTEKYTAEARLERGNGFSGYVNLNSTKSAYSLQFTYFLR